MKRRYVKYQGTQAETAIINFTVSSTIHTGRILHSPVARHTSQSFSQLRGLRPHSECPYGFQNGSSIKSEMLQSFMISQSNSICVMLEKKGKEVTKSQLYSS